MSIELNKAEVNEIKILIDAICELEQLRDFYKADKPGPAYLTIERFVSAKSDRFQLDHDIMVPALEDQLARYKSHLLTEFGVVYVS